MKITAEQAKSQMVAERYRAEQNFTRQAAIDACVNKNVAIECYAGQGHLTNVYRQYFNEVITNDINKDSPSNYHLPAMKFLEQVIKNLDKKIDHIDFDCYGCPSYEVQKYFEVRENKDFPLTISISDGFGMYMKRNKAEEPIKKRYLLEGNIDTIRIWDRHLELVDNMITTLAKKHSANATRIEGVQTKFKNYVLCSYLVK